MLHCLGIYLYDPATNKLIIAHFDIGNDPAQIQCLFNEFKPGAKLQMRIFGGMSSQQVDDFLLGQHEESKKLLNNLLYFLAKTAQGDFIVDIISNDSFEKLAAFKREVLEKKQPGKINFAIDCRTGKLVQQEGESTPYTVPIETCGLFTGIYQTRGVCPRMHRYLNDENEKLFKWLDYSSRDAFAHCEQQLEQACLHGIARILIAELNEFVYAVNDRRSKTDALLRDFILSNLSELLGPFSTENPIQIVLDHACVHEINRSQKGKLNLCRYNTIEALPLTRIIQRGVIQDWCLNNIRKQVAGIIAENGEVEMMLLRELSSFKGALHLLEDCISFQQCHFESRSCAPHNLLDMLRNREGQNIKNIIDVWVARKIEAGVERFLNIITRDLQMPFNHPAFRSFIRDFLMHQFRSLQQQGFNLDIFHLNDQQTSEGMRKLNTALLARLDELSDEIARARSVEPRTSQSFLSCFPCYSSNDPPPSTPEDAIEERAKKIIVEMLNTHFEALLNPINSAALLTPITESTNLKSTVPRKNS